MAKYIVTGGAGFIGSHLTQALLERGDEVVVLDNLSTGYAKNLPEHKNLTFVQVDISDWNALSRNFGYLKDAYGIFHFAACARIQPSVKNPMLTHDANVTGTLNLLEAMKSLGIPNIVYSASSSCYGKNAKPPCKETDLPDCQTPYSITKYMGEMYCETWGKLWGLNSIRLRYFNVYGPRSPLAGPYAPVIGLFFRQAIKGQPLTVIGDGEQRRDFTYVTDVVDANIKAMNKMEGAVLDGFHVNSVVNIGTGRNYSINDLALSVQNSFYDTSYLPPKIVHTPERVGEAKLSLADNSKAKKFLGWEPTIFLEQSILTLKEYYLANKDKILRDEPV